MSEKEHTEVAILNELSPPPSAYLSTRNQEILRVWVVNGGDLEVNLIPGFEAPGTWGILLVDLARHAARSYEMDREYSFDDAMAEIKELFEAEWSRPTDMGQTFESPKQ